MTVVGLPDHRAQIEADLYEAVRAIERSPTLFWEFDPVNLIRAVNTLQAMSETRAVDALKAYNTLCESDPRPLWPVFEAERIFWITRLLYVPKDPASSLRPPILGMPAVRVAAGSDLNAVFPLVLQDDVPFRLNSGYTLFGVAELPLAYLEYCRSAGKFRDAPLRPSSDPIAAATKFLESGRLAGLLAEPTEFFARFKEDIHGQALSAAGNFIGNPRQWAKKDWMIDCSEADWAQVSEKARIAGAVWSETACDFVATPKKSKN
jgi:hypothetical protein